MPNLMDRYAKFHLEEAHEEVEIPEGKMAGEVLITLRAEGLCHHHVEGFDNNTIMPATVQDRQEQPNA